jgi:hypothetical protein
MNTDDLLNKINNEASFFEKITLDQMEEVKLMDRMDVKYLIPLHLLPDVLYDARQFYKLLEINNELLCSYETLYYDTDDYQLYHSHQSGKLNRYKVRFRNYVGSNLSFFEIKHKNNKGRTLKTRIKQPNTFEKKLNAEKAEFLEKTTPLSANDLKGNLMVNYKRMTLVNKTSKERLTMDLDLTFIKNHNEVIYNQLVVAEIKQEKLGASPIIDIFKKYNLRAGSISKYCLGIMSTDSDVKHNRFKTKFLHLKKIITQYDSFARISNKQ